MLIERTDWHSGRFMVSRIHQLIMECMAVDGWAMNSEATPPPIRRGRSSIIQPQLLLQSPYATSSALLPEEIMDDIIKPVTELDLRRIRLRTIQLAVGGFSVFLFLSFAAWYIEAL